MWTRGGPKLLTTEVAVPWDWLTTPGGSRTVPIAIVIVQVTASVEAMGLEPTTSTLQRSHSSQLSYAPGR